MARGKFMLPDWLLLTYRIMTFVHNNYKTLNVAKEASKPAIRKAYLSLAKKYHPDVNRAPNGR